MKIRIISDLHIDFDWWFPSRLRNDKHTTLVIAGDICSFLNNADLTGYLTQLSSQFERIIYIAGNHEYEGVPVNTELNTFKSKLNLPNVHILENEILKLGKYNFIGATMWTDFDNKRILDASYRYRDYTRNLFDDNGVIRFVDPVEIYDIHMKSKKFVFDAIDDIQQRNEKAIVITHHSPSFLSLDERYKKDIWDFNGHFHNHFDELLTNRYLF